MVDLGMGFQIVIFDLQRESGALLNPTLNNVVYSMVLERIYNNSVHVKFAQATVLRSIPAP